jgi:capsid protein
MTPIPAANIFDPVLMPAATRFNATGGGYDATIAKGRRKVPVARSRSEDAELNNSERQILGGSTRDLRRNFAIAANAIRKHLDYVSTFTFQSRCSNDAALVARYGLEAMTALDDQIEALMAWWQRPQNFDAGGRHSLPRMIRIAEASRTVDGDVLVVERKDGKVQLVESDRIRNPIGPPATDIPPERMIDVINGVLLNQGTGAADGYCVHKRDRSGLSLQWDRLVPAAFGILHGYYDRYDQVRGISPLAAAVNNFRDLYESFDYALAKMKVEQLFALAFYRENSDPTGTVSTETTTDDEGNTTGTHYNIDFSRGPVQLDLDPGDRAEFLESKNPSSQSQEFWKFTIMVALKALDIPYSFFSEDFTTYSGSRIALLQYDQSADVKRNDNRELLNRLTAWRAGLFILDGDLALPRGMRISDLRWEWISKGIPWVDPLKEITANITAVAAGLADPQKIIKAQGDDPFEIIDRIAEFQAYAKEKDVTLSFVTPEIPTDPANEDTGGAKPNAAKKPAKPAGK